MNKARNQYKSKSDSPEKKPKKPKTKRSVKVKLPGGFTRFFSDTRIHRITGLVCLLFSAYLLIAFTSFLFTWKADQDKLVHSWWELITNPELQIDNWLGSLGAIVSHQFIHNWFGISSYLFVLLFFLVGFRVLFKISLLPLKKTFTYSLFTLLWVSMALGTFVSGSAKLHYLGGAFGYSTNKWLSGLLGGIGAVFLVFFVLAVFIIVFFDPSLNRLKGLFSGVSAETDSDEESAQAAPASGESWFVPPTEDALEDIPEPVLKQAEPEAVSEIELEEEPQEATEAPSNEGPELELETATPSEEEIALAAASLTPTVAPIVTEPDSSIELETEIPEEVKEEETGVVDELDKAIEEAVAKKQEEAVSSSESPKNPVEEFGEYDPTLELSGYQFPPIDLLEAYSGRDVQVGRDELENNKNRIVETLKNYNIQIAKIKATIGPTVTLYEIVPAAGVRISKIKNLEDDIALSLSALGIRIIAPIPGRGTIGIEVPNQKPEIVAFRTVAATDKFQKSDMDLPIVMGKTISNETYTIDLAKMPHLLMAGATGQGKSVGLNVILASLLYKKHPAEVKFVLVDPKKVELTLFNKIERHFLAKLPGEEEPIITDTKKVVNTVNSLCVEMDQRYELLKVAQTRNIKEYNVKFKARKLNPENGHRYLPYIVLVVDEFADLIMTAGKEVETPIARLAQLARAIGIHLIIATQRPSVNIITGTIKANFPTRIAFRVTSKIDSRTILDAGGADQLIGRGDMLLSTGSELLRLQCAFVDTPEVERITNFIGEQRAYPDAMLLPEYIDESSGSQADMEISDRDALFEDAARIVVLHQQGSASLLQRKLKLGYNRAGRIVDQLEAAGIIGPFEGSKARQVLLPDEMSLEQLLKAESQEI